MNKMLKICKALLFPPLVIRILLIPVAVVWLIYSMTALGTESAVSVLSYVFAAYALTVWCIRIPNFVAWCKTFKTNNKYAKRWCSDVRLRTNVALYASFLLNAVYAIFQLWLGWQNSSSWFYFLAGYYLSLAVMRLFLVLYTQKNVPGERIYAELRRYRACGWIFLIMNTALSGMIFFMVYGNRTFIYGEVTAIAMAAYTFAAFTVAIVNLVKYRKYHSPVYTATKIIGLAAACVSMLTLTSAMLTAFATPQDSEFRTQMLAFTGGSVSIFIITMAICMIVQGTKKLNQLSGEVQYE